MACGSARHTQARARRVTRVRALAVLLAVNRARAQTAGERGRSRDWMLFWVRLLG